MFIGKAENGKWLIDSNIRTEYSAITYDGFLYEGGKGSSDEAQALLDAFVDMPDFLRAALPSRCVAYFVAPEKTYEEKGVVCFVTDVNKEIPGHEIERGIIYGNGIRTHSHTDGDGEIYVGGYTGKDSEGRSFGVGFPVDEKRMFKTVCRNNESHGVDQTEEKIYLKYVWFESEKDIPKDARDVTFEEYFLDSEGGDEK